MQGKQRSIQSTKPEIASEEQDIRPSRLSKVTARHDAGSGANETEDGLDASNEAIRRGAEDVPVGDEADTDLEDVPVGDRGRLTPKV